MSTQKPLRSMPCLIHFEDEDMKKLDRETLMWILRAIAEYDDISRDLEDEFGERYLKFRDDYWDVIQ